MTLLISHLSPGRTYLKLSEGQRAAVAEFNAAVKSGQYPIESPMCLCGAGDSRLLARYDKYGLWSPVVICRRCGLIQSRPRLTEEAYGVYYASDQYRRICEGETEDLSYAQARFDGLYGRHIFEALEPVMAARGLTRVLEFGCAAGWNLIHFARAGYECAGCDHSPSLAALGRRNGLALRAGSFEAIEGRYDVIVINHVIEHFTDPKKALDRLSGHLNDGGVFYIGLPDMDNYYLGQLMNAHVYYYTPRTFLHYMARFGLEPIRTGVAEEEHMFGIFQRSGIGPGTGNGLEDEYRLMRGRINRVHARQWVKTGLERLGLAGIVHRSDGRTTSRNKV
ncbi:MAG: class I SAM-dependent methyltransferase [Proteobacteria bacterium]|nr:class I SAM-dependent methyltransferase [Pseudomonadota bacterium]